jgi:hypothetical protein
VKRLWLTPLWAHASALALVLVALAGVVRTGDSLSADEGAAIVQARTLTRDGTWVRAHPLPAVDPPGRMYPLENSGAGPDGRAPFVRHPLYALLLAGADRLGGVTAMVLLSIAATVAAAASAAALARRLDPGATRVVLWTVGLASPLLFDSYLVIAHSLGAAAAGLATLAGLRAVEGRSRWGLLAVGAIAIAALLRNEAVLLGGALAAGMLVAGWRVARVRAVALAAAVVGAGAAAHVAETAWQVGILGGRGASAGLPDIGSGVLGSRLDAFRSTWLSPGYRGWTTGAVLLVVMLVVTVAAAVQLRRREAGPAAVLAGVAAVLAVARVVAGPTDVVPGLLVAFPLLAVGLVLLARPEPLVAIAALFAVGVLATQYGRGGTAEWGGRYFALAVPVVTPVVVVALRDGLARVERPARTAIAVAVAVQAGALAVLAVAALRVGQQRTADLRHAVAAAPSSLSPVVLTGNGAVPRLMWRLLDDQRWLLVQGVEPAVLAGRLRGAGIDEVTVVDPIGRDDLRHLPGYRVTRERGARTASNWRVTVLRAA